MTEQPTDPRRIALIECLTFMVDDMAKVVFNTSLYPWQRQVILHMAMMPINGSGVPCAPLLLVRRDGKENDSCPFLFITFFTCQTYCEVFFSFFE